MRDARNDIIDLFEKRIFPFRGNVFKKREELKESKCFEYVENKSEGISYDLFKKYFDFEAPTQLTKKLIWNKR